MPFSNALMTFRFGASTGNFAIRLRSQKGTLRDPDSFPRHGGIWRTIEKVVALSCHLRYVVCISNRDILEVTHGSDFYQVTR